MRRLLNIFLIVLAVLGLTPALWGMSTMQVGSPSASYWEHQTGHYQPDFTSYDANWHPISSPVGCFEDGPNTYDYVGQNPWTNFDPEGLSYLDANGHLVVMPGENMACVGGYGNGRPGMATLGQNLASIPGSVWSGTSKTFTDLAYGAYNTATSLTLDGYMQMHATEGGRAFDQGMADAHQALNNRIENAVTSTTGQPINKGVEITAELLTTLGIGGGAAKTDAAATKVVQDVTPAVQLTQDAKTATVALTPTQTQAATIYGPFHRLGDSPDTVTKILTSGELWGAPPRNIFASDIPAAKAYVGPLPPGAKGFEFYTTVAPNAGTPPGQALWTGPRSGVTVEPFEYAKIPVKVTKVSEAPSPAPSTAPTTGN